MLCELVDDGELVDDRGRELVDDRGRELVDDRGRELVDDDEEVELLLCELALSIVLIALLRNRV